MKADLIAEMLLPQKMAENTNAKKKYIHGFICWKFIKLHTDNCFCSFFTTHKTLCYQELFII